MKQEIGGGRIGSGNKLHVDLKEYGRSSHDLGYLWRSSMAAGTLVPFMVELALPGDTFDINLNAEVRTHPTLGPLFGSYKVQLDVYEVPMRLYNAQLHNNRLGVGMNIGSVQFPYITINSPNVTPGPNSTQINPSNLLAYLGIRGLGYKSGSVTTIQRKFNAMPLLGYWEIFKNYYANKMETNAYVINSAIPSTNPSGVTDGLANPISQNAAGTNTPLTTAGLMIGFPASAVITINNANSIQIQTSSGALYYPTQLFGTYNVQGSGTSTPKIIFSNPLITTTMLYWLNITSGSSVTSTPQLTAFALSNIDDMRENILTQPIATPYAITSSNAAPYNLVTGTTSGVDANNYSQQGLAVKTYQSDRYNNWLQTAWQTQISTQTAVSTAGNQFTIDQIVLAKKMYDMLNRVAVSGGSYQDWIHAVYTTKMMQQAESPVYHGGLSKELLFQEVISMASSQSSTGQQYLGQQGGKGMMHTKHKGGQIVIHVKEPGYIMGIVSLTPRIDYSQGNKWHTNLLNMANLHLPALDELGFQNLITDEMAYWDTICDNAGNVTYYSAGLQPAWIQYMTNTNQLYGNFALQNNEMFMTLNRYYQQNTGTGRISDLTTYIDPSKFNFIFAQTSLDAQNFWVQIANNITARRVMSAKIMPNL